MDKKVLVPIAHGTEEMEAVVVVDLLRRAGFTVRVAGDNEIVTCSRGMKIIPDILIRKIKPDDVFDAVILPGGVEGTQNLHNNEYIIDILKSHNEKGKIIGAICAAPTILTAYNITPKGIDITSHPSVINEMVEYHYLTDKVVVYDNFVTSRAAGTVIEFALKIIELLAGKELADKISEQILYN